MDNFNVIEPTNDIDKLNSDMAAWCSLPYNFRLRSNEECIRKYGMTNIDLFNKNKSMLMDNELETKPDIENVEKFIFESVNVETDDHDFEFEDIEDRLIVANELNKSPNTVIITPFDRSTLEIQEKFNKYNLLIQKFKLFSNSYSIQLWGYDVPNMYNIMIGKVETDVNIIATLGESLHEQSFSIVTNDMNKAMFDNDLINLYKIKLESFEKLEPYHQALFENARNNIDSFLNERNFNLPQVVPYFTIDEMNRLGGTFDTTINNYKSDIVKAMEDYKKDPSVTNESALINLGWNPSVDITPRSLEFARNKQNKWLSEHSATIVDITNEEYINESSSNMRNLYKENDLYPIYIVLSFSYTLFGKIIKKIKHSEYSHAGLCLDSNLKEIYTFKFGSDWNGFSIEDLSTYLQNSTNAEICVLCLFVDKKSKDKIEYNLNEFVKNKDKTKYGFGNLFNILFNKSKEYDPNNLSLVCSQFVDTVLKLSNIDLTNKTSNVVIPEDLNKLVNNPKVYKLYEGLVSNFDEKKIESDICSLFNSQSIYDLKYSNTVKESVEANTVLEELKSLLKPTSIFI